MEDGLKLNDLAKEVIKIASQAAKLIVDIYESKDIDLEFKTDESPITKADKAANDLICRGLSKITPNIPIITEENAIADYSIRKNYTYFWLVDPLDGTKEFVNRNGEFTINVALIHQEKPILGVVLVPVSGVSYWGAKGLGAFKIEKSIDSLVEGMSYRSTTNEQLPTILKVSTFTLNDAELRFPCSRSHLNELTKSYFQGFINPIVLPVGSALKFMLIAEGMADIYPRFGGKMMEWDTAAAQIIVKEAGGSLINLSNNKPLEYNKPIMDTPDFICMGLSQTKTALAV
jgi:3'(2'), 5'-bisphosphate nucleotidase